MPSGMPTISARMKPARNSFVESRSCVKLPLTTSCQSRTSVSENGTMKALLALRPAISQTAIPANTLIQTGAWRRMVLLSTYIDPVGNR